MRKILILFTLIPFFANSQNIELKGTIYSGYSEKPLEEVFITITPSNGKSKFFYPDSLGRYKISGLEPEKYQLEVTSFGYNKIDTTLHLREQSNIELNFILPVDCIFNKESAEEDIKSQTPKLLLIGGFAPISNSEEDYLFEKKYQVKYFDFGCNPDNLECVVDYNRRIFDYLDEIYGKSWRKKVRKDIIVKEKF